MENGVGDRLIAAVKARMPDVHVSTATFDHSEGFGVAFRKGEKRHGIRIKPDADAWNDAMIDLLADGIANRLAD